MPFHFPQPSALPREVIRGRLNNVRVPESASHTQKESHSPHVERLIAALRRYTDRQTLRTYWGSLNLHRIPATRPLITYFVMQPPYRLMLDTLVIINDSRPLPPLSGDSATVPLNNAIAHTVYAKMTCAVGKAHVK